MTPVSVTPRCLELANQLYWFLSVCRIHCHFNNTTIKLVNYIDQHYDPLDQLATYGYRYPPDWPIHRACLRVRSLRE